MKKKIIPVLVLLLVVILIPMAGSLAFFTAGETAHNVITSGNVDIRLLEFSNGGVEGGELKPFENRKNILPGDKVSKIVQIENTGSGDAWVRVHLNPEMLLTDSKEDLSREFVSLDIDSSCWTEKEPGCYYYKKALKPGEISEPLMRNVTFSAAMDNRAQNAVFTLDVSAEAVQSKNNGETPFEALGWPTELTTP